MEIVSANTTFKWGILQIFTLNFQSFSKNGAFFLIAIKAQIFLHVVFYFWAFLAYYWLYIGSLLTLHRQCSFLPQIPDDGSHFQGDLLCVRLKCSISRGTLWASYRKHAFVIQLKINQTEGGKRIFFIMGHGTQDLPVPTQIRVKSSKKKRPFLLSKMES